MFPCCQHYRHAAQADNGSGGGSPNWFSPPNHEALVGKLLPAAPGVTRLQGTNLDATYSAAAIADPQIGASQAC